MNLRSSGYPSNFNTSLTGNFLQADQLALHLSPLKGSQVTIHTYFRRRVRQAILTIRHSASSAYISHGEPIQRRGLARGGLAHETYQRIATHFGRRCE
jgi:hypothetical protein